MPTTEIARSGSFKGAGLVISTPMYGGQCTAEYFLSCVDLERTLTESGIPHTFLITTNESLIPRARNTAVARFLFDPALYRFDRFMFIDADIEFTPEDVQKLWNLDVDVATAAYPMKREEAGVSAWKDGRLVNLDDFNGPTEIDFAGTGFLMIKRSVFEKMTDKFPWLLHEEGKIGKCVALFQDQMSDLDEIVGSAKVIVDAYAHARHLERTTIESVIHLGKILESDWKNRFSLSEDYTFTQRWRDVGGKIILDPSIRLGHVGRKIFR